MPKGFAEAGPRDDSSRDSIDFFAGPAGPNGVDSRELRLQHHSIDFPQFWRDFTGHDNTSQVAHVEPGVDAPVDQREIALAEPTIRRPRVWQCRAIADGHDRREAQPLRAESPSLVLK